MVQKVDPGSWLFFSIRDVMLFIASSYLFMVKTLVLFQFSFIYKFRFV